MGGVAAIGAYRAALGSRRRFDIDLARRRVGCLLEEQGEFYCKAVTMHSRQRLRVRAWMTEAR